MRTSCLWPAVSSLALAQSSPASITTYFDDKVGWGAAAGTPTMIDFVGDYPYQEVPYDHWSSLGITVGSVHFPEGCNWVLKFPYGESLDGWAASTASGFTYDPQVINFAVPQHAFAHEEWSFFTEPVGVTFYLGGQALGTSVITMPVPGPDGVYFFGWTTDFAFDRVAFLYSDPIDAMYIVPAPGGLALGLLAAMLGGGTRRRSIIRNGNGGDGAMDADHDPLRAVSGCHIG